MKKVFFIIIDFDWFSIKYFNADNEKHKSDSAWGENEVATFTVWFYDYSTY